MKTTVKANSTERIRPIGPVKSVVIDSLFKQTPKKNPYIKSKRQLKMAPKVWEYNNEY